MKVSYLQPNAPSPFNGKPQKVGQEYTGTKLQIVELEDVLEQCKGMPLGHEKRVDGAVFPMMKDSVGNADWNYYGEVFYDGVLFVDLDHLTKDMADTIFNGFEKLYTKYPFYLAIQYSSSYYIRPESDDVGLHIYVMGPKGDGYDYKKYSRFAMATTSELIRIEFGIDLLSHHWKILAKSDDKVLDTSICKIAQRFYLYHSDYKLNPHCFPMSVELYDKNVIKLVGKYDWVIPETDNYKKAEFDNQYVMMGKVVNKIQLDYKTECPIANFLANNGWDVDKIVAALMLIDNRDDAAYQQKHGFTRLSHFRQIARTAQHKGMSESQRDYAISLLRRCGLVVEEDIPNNYEIIPSKVYRS